MCLLALVANQTTKDVFIRVVNVHSITVLAFRISGWVNIHRYENEQN